MGVQALVRPAGPLGRPDRRPGADTGGRDMVVSAYEKRVYIACIPALLCVTGLANAYENIAREARAS